MIGVINLMASPCCRTECDPKALRIQIPATLNQVIFLILLEDPQGMPAGYSQWLQPIFEPLVWVTRAVYIVFEKTRKVSKKKGGLELFVGGGSKLPADMIFLLKLRQLQKEAPASPSANSSNCTFELSVSGNRLPFRLKTVITACPPRTLTPAMMSGPGRESDGFKLGHGLGENGADFALEDFVVLSPLRFFSPSIPDRSVNTVKPSELAKGSPGSRWDGENVPPTVQGGSLAPAFMIPRAHKKAGPALGRSRWLTKLLRQTNLALQNLLYWPTLKELADINSYAILWRCPYPSRFNLLDLLR
ncbi:hypothetical protein DFH08DRAFT_822192 [Mycena albidolilacea]|uniref:Uncharacterized protein n=1 Tax=Mycena albidolilacea TaxID=1033008 RepID=A0AAD6Z8M1_9AGAR|nr:hypothetical protein DFH08DRAFT_822192 [Mycena albidolilacea]